jgi:Rab3 GTPase-activating protein catalytic subunit
VIEDQSKRDKKFPAAMKELLYGHDYPMESKAIEQDKHMCLSKYFGLAMFYVLEPENSSVEIDEALGMLLLSAACISAQNTNCAVPIFVPVHSDPYKYFGRMCSFDGSADVECQDYSTKFSVQCAPNSPGLRFESLSGMISYFHELANVDLDSISASVSCLYIQKSQEWLAFDLTRNWRNFEDDQELTLGLNWGPLSVKDPVIQIELKTSWNHFAYNEYTEDAIYSDFDPRFAKEAEVRVKWNSVYGLQDFPLTVAVDVFLNMLNSGSSVESIEDVLFSDFSSFNASSFSSKAMNAFLSASIGTNPAVENIQNILDFVFLSKSDSVFIEKSAEFKHAFYLESVPYGSILSRLMIAILKISCTEIVDLKAIAILWDGFLKRVRSLWENLEPLPGFNEKEIPDLRCSIFHQKLQLLNRCIHLQKRLVLNQEYNYEPPSSSKFSLKDLGISLDDHSHNDSGWAEALSFDELKLESDEKRPIHKAEGINFNVDMKDMVLLSSGLRMNAPITQEHPIMTSDKFEEQQEILSNLGTSKEASLLRAEIQGATVFSDMQAFKAANPMAEFADFVRWYSPNDWIIDSGVSAEELSSLTSKASCKKGAVSSRMADSSNLWSKLWKKADPVPAQKQVPLFDHVKEAELALDFMKTISPLKLFSEFAKIGLATALHLFHRISQYLYFHVSPEKRNHLYVLKCFESVERRIVALMQNHDQSYIWNHKAYMKDQFVTLELLLAKVASLFTKIGFEEEVTKLVDRLLIAEDDRTTLVDEEERRNILNFFTFSKESVDFDLPAFTEKEYRLIGFGNYESNLPNPSSERIAVQRMFVSHSNKPKSCVLAAAWSSAD